jgi:YVTN family beta-propeller protein
MSTGASLLRLFGLFALAALFHTRCLAQTVIASVTTGANASAIAINETTNTIYVVHNDTNGIVTAIDGGTNATSSIAVGTNPDGIAVNAVTNKIYVSNGGASNVTEIDGASKATLEIPVGANPGAIVVNPVANKVYVLDLNNASPANGSVVEINGVTNAALTSVPASNPGPGGAFADAIAVNTQNGRVYALDFNDSILDQIFGDVNSCFGSTGFFGSAVAVNQVTGFVYVTNVTKNTVSSVDSGTLVAKVYTTGNTPRDVAVNSVTNKIYVANADGTVTVLDGVTNAIATVSAGSNPVAIAVDAATNKVYVVDKTANGTVTVIDGATNATLSVAVGANPFALAIDAPTNLIYVVNGDPDGTVSVIQGAVSAPTFSTGPQSQTMNLGSPVAFSVDAGPTGSTTFRWSLNGAPLTDGNGVSGSATTTLFIGRGVASADAGSYACTATNSSGSATSSAAILSVVTSANPGRLIDISSRASVGTGAGIMIAGFAVQGGSKAIILRGAGPTLGALGVPGVLSTPVLSLFDSASPANLITQDSGWLAPPTVPSGVWSGKVSPADPTPADFMQVGAFAFGSGSSDAALKLTVPAGVYTSQVAGIGTATGVALAEVYDADQGNPSSQLFNISARASVGTGSNILIAGFVVAGSTSQTVLIRASGPALTDLGVSGALADPQVQLFDGGQHIIGSNFGWAGSSQIENAAASVGAFAWGNPASDDSALLVTLPPGDYTAQISGASGDNGIALVEVYALH